MDADVEAKARAIADQAKSQRKQLPRSAWSASLIIAVLCVAALVIGYLVKPATPVEPSSVRLGHDTMSVPSHETIHGVFGVEFFIGVVAGIGIGVTIGRRQAARDDQPIKSSHS